MSEADHTGFVLIQESATGVYLTTHRKILDHTESSPLFNILSPDLNYIAMRINDRRISLLSAKFTEKDEISRNAIVSTHLMAPSLNKEI